MKIIYWAMVILCCIGMVRAHWVTDFTSNRDIAPGKSLTYTFQTNLTSLKMVLDCDLNCNFHLIYLSEHAKLLKNESFSSIFEDLGKKQTTYQSFNMIPISYGLVAVILNPSTSVHVKAGYIITSRWDHTYYYIGGGILAAVFLCCALCFVILIVCIVVKRAVTGDSSRKTRSMSESRYLISEKRSVNV